MIKLKNITKHFGKKEIINNINLDLPLGKMVAFIGSNGAGKSTLLSIISRLSSPTSGEIIINDKEVNSWKSEELAKCISILKQSNELNLRLTVKDLVGFGRFPYSKGKLQPEDLQKIDEAINFMGIKHLENNFLDELSGGQRQMAYIAMVIAQDTDYIFLDEPLNNLDMKHSVKIMKILKELVSKYNKTIFVVIHDINFVSCYADHIIALKGGDVIANGSVRDVMQKEILSNVYDMEIDIQKINDNHICIYYQ